MNQKTLEKLKKHAQKILEKVCDFSEDEEFKNKLGKQIEELKKIKIDK